MHNLIHFIHKYHFGLLFVFLELISLTLLVQNNFYHKATFINSSNAVVGNVYNFSHSFGEYLDLKYSNDKLLIQNKELLDNQKTNILPLEKYYLTFYDSTINQHYSYITAQVINNSVNKIENYITINKGLRQGIRPNMAVIFTDGVVGVVKKSSENFSSIVSVLNKNLSISAKLKASNYFGSLSWSGEDNSYANLNEIPLHVNVKKGDTVVTSGYSAAFPKNIVIGVISDFERIDGDSFVNIKVKLAVDFKKLSYVYVVENLFIDEQKQLENQND